MELQTLVLVNDITAMYNQFLGGSIDIVHNIPEAYFTQILISLHMIMRHIPSLVSRGQTLAGRRVWSTAHIRLVPTPTPTGVGDK